jgi:hypothetical protein
MRLLPARREADARLRHGRRLPRPAASAQRLQPVGCAWSADSAVRDNYRIRTAATTAQRVGAQTDFAPQRT